MKTVTKEDVERDYEKVKTALLRIPTAEWTADTGAHPLARLRDTAAQVPALTELVHAMEEHQPGCAEVGATVRALQARVAELEADNEALRNEVDRVQARVAELERERDEALAKAAVAPDYEVLEAQWRKAESERDALRAQVEKVRQQCIDVAVATCQEFAAGNRDGAAAGALEVGQRLRALSTPPAEAKTAEADHEEWCGCARCVRGDYHPDE